MESRNISAHYEIAVTSDWGDNTARLGQTLGRQATRCSANKGFWSKFEVVWEYWG